ncbi:MAG TPA: glycosyltransferase family 4 protein [Jatrophihabitantaceae bacterium]|jgi:glycosyltransferase involved in cell wall biosynthesis|nr:glycosyltransferase family 4 protein [Jatrophihabitantaceae bacterium]
MRVHVHDYSGHPFQVQLSRQLAAQGHEVVHGYCTQYVTGRGLLERGPGDPTTLAFAPLSAGVPLVKYAPVARTRFELSYAAAWQRQLDADQFDVVVACNVPLFALARMRQYFAARGQRWVLWHQDIYSLALAAEASNRLPRPAATAVSAAVQRLEAAQVRSADAVVAIGEGFVRQYREWGQRSDHVRVIPNWAPLEHIRPGRRDNQWAARNQLPTEPVRLLYAGTLGRKHNPLLLLDVLDAVRARGVDAILTVVSEGIGADDLAAAAGDRSDVRILGYQSAEDLPDMLASADAVIALLEPHAASFCVPSKVLSYLSAGRPIVALVPEGNPAADDVAVAGGFVGPPTREGARSAGEWVADLGRDPEGLAVLGKRARALAEERFDIGRIGAQFEGLLQQVVAGVEVPVAARRREVKLERSGSREHAVSAGSRSPGAP